MGRGRMGWVMFIGVPSKSKGWMSTTLFLRTYSVTLTRWEAIVALKRLPPALQSGAEIQIHIAADSKACDPNHHEHCFPNWTITCFLASMEGEGIIVPKVSVNHGLPKKHSTSSLRIVTLIQMFLPTFLTSYSLCKHPVPNQSRWWFGPLGQSFSKCDPQNSCISIICEHVRNAKSQTAPPDLLNQTLGVRVAILVLTSPPGDSEGV